MRRLILAAVIVTAGGLGAAAAEPTPTASPEVSKMNGLWKPRSVVHDGQEQFPTAKSRESIMLAVKDGNYALWEVTDPVELKGRRVCNATIQIDPATRSINLEIKRGANAGQKMHGVYEVVGNELRICHAPADKPRPTTFAAPAGSGLMCETWELRP